MAQPPRGGTRTYRRLAWTATVTAFSLIVLGGIVRITGSGMGCGDDWPRCNGEWFPPLDLPTLIESSHRWAAALVSLLVAALAWVALRRHRREPSLRNPALLALVLLVVQVLLGAVTVKLELPPAVVIVHLVNAMLLLAALVVAALRSSDAEGASPGPRGPAALGWLVYPAAGLGLATILFGAKVANLHAGLVCQGFPLCNGQVLPPPTPLGWIHWAHRLLAFTFLGLAVAIVAAAGRRGDAAARPLRRAAWLVLGLTAAQIGVAAAMVLEFLPPGLRALHLLVGTAVWVGLVVLVHRARRTPAERAERAGSAAAEEGGRPSLLSDLVALTKPRIISLLLLTTLVPMFITPAGVPSFGLVLWVALGGYLMAGGANAINMWFDRDIDDKMARTRLRPIPAGRLSPGFVLAFGIALGAAAFWVFWRFVNPLSAWLALGGLLFYVFVYTMWLKRSTPQNIVVGGAAGAFPPLVGWASVTGSLDLAAVYLFAIIFYWTPPHFWALALVKRNEYARVGVPMMPVVRGERQTKIQMLVYTLMLLPLTVMPSVFGALGPFYGVSAAILGARLLWYCVQLFREESVAPVAWRMYRYSLLYLALLFAAMGVDRALPFGRREAPRVYILDRPTPEPDAAAAAAAPHHAEHPTDRAH